MKRGFTLLELACVLACLAVVIPSAFAMERTFEAHQHRALSKLAAADGVRTFSDQLRRDLRTMRWQDESSFTLTGRGGCKTLTYSIRDRQLWREGPGCGSRPLVAEVTKLERRGPEVAITFERAVSMTQSERTRFLFALPIEPTR